MFASDKMSQLSLQVMWFVTLQSLATATGDEHRDIFNYSVILSPCVFPSEHRTHQVRQECPVQQAGNTRATVGEK